MKVDVEHLKGLVKDSLFHATIESLNNFSNEEETISYYEHLLQYNPESSSYPLRLREFHTGLIMGLKGSIELRNIKKDGV